MGGIRQRFGEENKQQDAPDKREEEGGGEPTRESENERDKAKYPPSIKHTEISV